MSTINVNRIVDASGGVLAPISSVMRNRLIDAGFTINQRGYVSSTALSAGTYAHDRFKAGAGGCTYTFTQLSTGVPIVITITAGSLQQVIEGANMPEGGTYVLSWTGTAQARFNGGTYGSSPLAVTGITAGANTTIEFGTGTCSFPQLEVGSSATGYEYRQYQQELALCQRYYYKTYDNSVAPGSNVSANLRGIIMTGTVDSGGSQYTWASISFPVYMRSQPTINYWDVVGNATRYSTYSGATNGRTDNAGAWGNVIASNAVLSVNQAIPANTAGAFAFTASSEL